TGLVGRLGDGDDVAGALRVDGPVEVDRGRPAAVVDGQGGEVGARHGRGAGDRPGGGAERQVGGAVGEGLAAGGVGRLDLQALSGADGAGLGTGVGDRDRGGGAGRR